MIILLVGGSFNPMNRTIPGTINKVRFRGQKGFRRACREIHTLKFRGHWLLRCLPLFLFRLDIYLCKV